MRPVESAQDGAVEMVQALAAMGARCDTPVSGCSGRKVGRPGGVNRKVGFVPYLARKEPLTVEGANLKVGLTRLGRGLDRNSLLLMASKTS